MNFISYSEAQAFGFGNYYSHRFNLIHRVNLKIYEYPEEKKIGN